MPETEMTDVAGAESALSIVPVEGREGLSHVIMLAHRIWPDVYADILEPEQIRNMLLRIYNYEHLQKELADGHRFYVGYVGRLPVGYASAYLEDDIIWLKKLYVDRAWQGKRIGVRLMHAAVSALLPASEIRLLANPKNLPAHAFYTHAGFSRIGEMPVKMGDFEFEDFVFSMPLYEKN